MRSNTFLNMSIDRRRFFKIGMQAALCSVFPASSIAAINRLSASKRTLSLYNTHTDQKLDACYYAHGQYQTEALKKINRILRDHRTGEIKPMRKELLNLLHSISRALDRPTRFHIISGYRSPETNARLRIKNKFVSKHSFHVTGEAADIRLPDFPTKKLRNVCMQLKAGGVGYYSKSDFVHVDVGPVRHW
ncbi:MAG: DUF882 domain-containing protein [Deltaproteobacteria bacterium]|nr:DUF882 domain-containing protein [Deltaproteobacteria bacterium]